MSQNFTSGILMFLLFTLFTEERAADDDRNDRNDDLAREQHLFFRGEARQKRAAAVTTHGGSPARM
jgi:hypothetical protein